jgi:hypothetical protein
MHSNTGVVVVVSVEITVWRRVVVNRAFLVPTVVVLIRTLLCARLIAVYEILLTAIMKSWIKRGAMAIMIIIIFLARP